LTNIDYEKLNQHLPETLRLLVGQRNRVTKSVEYNYLRLQNANQQLAVLNNYNAYEIATGFSQAIHYSNLMTGTAPRLKDILRDKICSRVMVEGDDDSLALLKNKYSEARLTKDLKKAYDNAIATGRGVMVLDYINDKIKIRHFNLFRSKFKYDLAGDLIQADLFIQTKDTSAFDNFTIIERRYYNSDGKPCQKYVLTKVSWEQENSLRSNVVEYGKDQLSDELKKLFEGITFNREIELVGYNDLGVYLIDNTISNDKYPYSTIPQSQFVDVQDLLVEREQSETFKVVDKHLGRGRVIKPSIMKTGFDASASFGGSLTSMTFNPNSYRASGDDRTIFTQYESMTMDDCRPQSIQFDLRSEQWRTDINGLIGDICAVFGLTVLDFDPRLLVAGQRTDDEINAMNDITRATVNGKRDLNEETINNFINQVASLVGAVTPVFIRWSMTSILNPLRNSQLIQSQLANGTISQRTAIKRENPDYTDKEIDEEIERINNERKRNDYNQAFNEF
jgi:hypothetical protein